MKKYKEFVADAQQVSEELMPWDLVDLLEADSEGKLLIVDVRCPHEYETMRIKGSINVPRGILEPACEWAYEETVPELVEAREGRKVVLVCRSGNRSLLAARTMKEMGYTDVISLKTGLRGWNDSEYPLVDNADQPVSVDDGDEFFNRPVPKEKLGPGTR